MKSEENCIETPFNRLPIILKIHYSQFDIYSICHEQHAGILVSKHTFNSLPIIRYQLIFIAPLQKKKKILLYSIDFKNRS